MLPGGSISFEISRATLTVTGLTFTNFQVKYTSFFYENMSPFSQNPGGQIVVFCNYRGQEPYSGVKWNPPVTGEFKVEILTSASISIGPGQSAQFF